MTTPEANPSVLAPVAEPLALRVLRSALAIALVLALTFLIGLAVVGWSTTAREALAPLFSFTTKGVPVVAAVFTIAFIVITPTALFTLAARRRRLTWLTLALGWVVMLVVFAWLARDDAAIRRPLTIEEISPAFDGAQKSYAFLMRYAKQHPSEEAKAFAKFKPAVQWAGTGPREPEKWQEFLAKNRAGLEADWAALAPQRQWFADLNAFDRIGDLAPARFDSDLMSFAVWRMVSQRTCAAASCQVLDGRGDEALATILPLLELSRKLEPSSRTLVRTMIARVIQRLSLDSITFILNRHTPSPALRPRLAAALAGGNSPAGARRLILMEYPYLLSLVSSMRHLDRSLIEGEGESPIKGPLAVLSPFLFNPIATLNTYGDHLYELAGLAETRELGKFAVRSNSFSETFAQHGSPKNIGGALLLNLAVPAFDKVVKSYWEIEDLRAALHARVTALP